jgi:hypothetical protein
MQCDTVAINDVLLLQSVVIEFLINNSSANISLTDFVMSMEIPAWVLAVCSIGQNISKMATGTSPICLTEINQELPSQNATSTKLMCPEC